MSKANLRQILSSKQLKAGNTLFIAVDGRGGSGKSTLAKWLAEKLGASLVQTDDFATWDDPNWWPLVIERVFEPIKNGIKTLNYSRSSGWWDDHHPEPVVDQPITDIMILEGVSSSRKEFRDYISLSIFVNTPREISLRRGIERDSNTGKTEEEVTQMWEAWFKEEDNYIERDNPKEHADIVVDGTKSFEDQISIET